MEAKGIAISVSFALCGVSSAQSHPIRAYRNLNLRAAASLKRRGIAVAPQGVILQVVGALGRWLKIDRIGKDRFVRLAQEWVHDACHVRFWQAGVWFDEGWRNELPCHNKTLEAISALDPGSRWNAWDREVIANYKRHQTWWEAGPDP